MLRGEAPIASHLLLTQRGIFNDNDPLERKLGIACGVAWHEVADVVVFYVDRGWSSGMLAAHKSAREAGYAVDYRTIYKKAPGFEAGGVYAQPAQRPTLRSSGSLHPPFPS